MGGQRLRQLRHRGQQLSAKTAKQVPFLNGQSYDFEPGGPVFSDGTHVWVGDGDAVTEMNASSGAVIRVVYGTTHAIDGTVAIAPDRTDVWVAGGNSVAEIDASSGAVVRVLWGSGEYRFRSLVAIVTDGTDVWALSSEGNTITKFSASTGALVKRMTSTSYGFDGADGMALEGSNL